MGVTWVIMRLYKNNPSGSFPIIMTLLLFGLGLAIETLIDYFDDSTQTTGHEWYVYRG